MSRVRRGMDAIDCLEYLLGVGRPITRDQFESLDKRLARIESAYRLQNSILVERASTITMLENINEPRVAEHLGSMAAFGPGLPTISLAPEDSLNEKWCKPSYEMNIIQQQLWVLETMTAVAEVIDIPGQEATAEWDALQAKIQSHLQSDPESPLYFVFGGISNLRASGLAWRQRLFAARLALRVARHRTEFEKLPERLEVTLDEDLSEIPASLFDKTPPRYIVNGDAFTIEYSTPSSSRHTSIFRTIDVFSGSALH
ncbi:MAG: hypothetical protein KDA91_04145 [Planctomycetaceae bacterium]|nr:hypothetical protein [Planctomycetaceae bacterium]